VTAVDDTRPHMRLERSIPEVLQNILVRKYQIYEIPDITTTKSQREYGLKNAVVHIGCVIALAHANHSDSKNVRNEYLTSGSSGNITNAMAANFRVVFISSLDILSTYQ